MKRPEIRVTLDKGRNFTVKARGSEYTTCCMIGCLMVQLAKAYGVPLHEIAEASKEAAYRGISGIDNGGEEDAKIHRG